MEASTTKIVLNVGGVRFRTCRGTLRAFPGTKLGSLTEPPASSSSSSSEELDYDPKTKEFFFDRSSRLFEHVLDFYRSGHLHCPAEVCRSVFQEELDFWGLTDTQLPACCWSKLCQAGSQVEEADSGHFSAQDEQQGLLEQVERRNSDRRAGWKLRIWDFLEKPYSSRWALGFTAISLLFNVAVILLLCVKGNQYFPSSMDTNFTLPHLHHVSVAAVCPQTPSLLHLELFFVLCFTCEFVARLMSCPDKKKFLQNPLNVVDFFSLFPVYVDLFFSGRAARDQATPCWLNLLRVVYIIKVLKVFKLVETPLMLRIYPYMIKSVLKEIAVLMWVFIFEIVFFGTLVYFGERSLEYEDSHFANIFSSFWWATITLTTVGYGDMVPIGTLNRIIGSCTALCGVLTIITPIPIFFIKFKRCYDIAVIKEKMKRELKQVATLTT